MTIHSLSDSGQPAAGSTAPPVGPTSVTEDQFLRLLVAQMKNQDPTNPTDSTTFVTQLAQFSQLEQIVAIRGDIESQISQNAAQGAANSGGNS